MDTKELAKWVANNRLSVNGALLAKSTQDAILSALELAAAVEGPEEATPETDASLIDIDGKRYVPNGCAELLAIARTLERQRNAALIALKAERERAGKMEAALRHERNALYTVRDRQDGRASHADITKGIALIDVALAAQEGRHD